MTRRFTLISLLCVLPLAMLPSQAREIRLKAANARIPFEFDRIVGWRELSDGRVLVSDSKEKVVVVVDFAAGTATQIGRRGQGPGEYADVAPLYSLGPDSTLMPDLARWMLLSREKIAGTIRVDDSTLSVLQRIGMLRGVDHRGKALVGTPPAIRPGKQSYGVGDSTALVLLDLTTRRADTIAMVRMAPWTMQVEMNKEGKPSRVGLITPPFSVGEEAIMFPDGAVAITRLDPYRVDWRGPDGRWVRGKPLPFVARPVSAPERQMFVARRAEESGTDPVTPPEDSWPEVIPPFQPRSLLALPDGSVLVHRTPTLAQPDNRYDRVDRSGNLVSTLVLPTSDRVIGVGMRGVYVAVTDQDGIQRLQRHPSP